MISEEQSSDIGLNGALSLSKSYLLPYNDVEIHRLNEQHKLISEIYEGRVVVAPVYLTEMSEVLDVAAGSGAWALDFAERYPTANKAMITCADINASMFPKAHPPNMTFHVASVLTMPSEWTNKFTLVHQRLIRNGIKYHEWKQDIQEIYKVTEPGGWAQLCERDQGHKVTETNYQPGPAQAKAMKLVVDVADANGMDFLCAERIPGLMKEAGFVDVHKEERTEPLGMWNSDLSRRLTENMVTIFRGFRDAVLKQGGLGVVSSGEEYDMLIDEVEREWTAGPGGYDSFTIFIGKKPK